MTMVDSKSRLEELVKNAPESVEASVRYTLDDEEMPIVYNIEYTATTIKFESHDVRMNNARKSANDWNTEDNGFQLIEMKSALKDTSDTASIKTIYHAECEEKLKELTGARKVIVFHSALRDLGREISNENFHAAANVHIDYNQESYEYNIRQFMGAEADELLGGRWAAYNIWKPFAPVEMSPLAVCDARSVERSDLVLCGMGTRPGEPLWEVHGVNVMYNPRHEWYYFPFMSVDEAMVIKLCDTDTSKPQLTAHTAFDDPTTPRNPVPRVSIEARCIAFF
ncbi:CmcJ/NvfI family oxidoreductase [Sphingobium sp. EP60837]|uniref:CmcJ/NvfI family oxidoreductase n=1 Tax=Sphingobium sp. EP60837 TaxID=1855519 RepID=UPI0007DD5CD9|nr:CmcJ/NvfI family oxidoreductase [Sphingobium sp. EP60837]ANI80208.1 hypothetical protein EP837_03828 [Sphingobium sp. EP60837]